jgi:hypothetical protein
MIPCGLKERSSKAVRRVGEGDRMGWPMAFQHANEITHVEVPHQPPCEKYFG